jgi:hypothetical protein
MIEVTTRTAITWQGYIFATLRVKIFVNGNATPTSTLLSLVVLPALYLPSRRGIIGACRYPLGCVRRFQLRARLGSP